MAQLLQRRQQGGARVVARTDETQPHFAHRFPSRRRLQIEAGGRRTDRAWTWVDEQNPQVRFLPLTEEQGVRLVGIVDREPVRHQGPGLQRRYQVEERFHVALERPAHVLVGVVDAPFLVVAVISTGAVRA